MIKFQSSRDKVENFKIPVKDRFLQKNENQKSSKFHQPQWEAEGNKTVTPKF